MNQQLITTNQAVAAQTTSKALEPSEAGRAALDLLRTTWGKTSMKKSKVVLNEETNEPEWGEVEVVIERPNTRLNRGVAPVLYKQFANLMRPEDEERINAIIVAGSFEVVKAVAAFTAADFALDRSVRVKSWSEAEGMHTASGGVLVKYLGEEDAVAVIFTEVFAFVKKFGKRSDVDESIAEELAIDILKTYPRLTVADLKYIFAKAFKIAQKTMPKLLTFSADHSQIMQLLDIAWEDRLADHESRLLDSHENLKGEKRYRARRGYVPERVLSPKQQAIQRDNFKAAVANHEELVAIVQQQADAEAAASKTDASE